MTTACRSFLFRAEIQLFDLFQHVQCMTIVFELPVDFETSTRSAK